MTHFPNDDLRTRLSRIDPAGPDVPVDPPTSHRAAELKERIMRQPDVLPPVELPAFRRRRRPVLLGAALMAAAAAVVGALVLGGNGGPGGEPGGGPGGGSSDDSSTLALSLPAAGEAPRCRAFDVALLRSMPVAFGGTVTSVSGKQVTLDVTRWYEGGDADRVTIAVPGGPSAPSLDPVDFRSGKRYLVTATDGTVNGCGLSGPATTELEAAFAEAFGG